MSESQQQRGQLPAPAGKPPGAAAKEQTSSNEFLDVILPIAQPTSDPGLTCSGLDAGIEIEDIVFSDEVKSSGKVVVEQAKSVRIVAGARNVEEEAGGVAELPEEKSLSASEVVGNLPVTTIDAGENPVHHGSTNVTTTAGENEQTITIQSIALAEVEVQVQAPEAQEQETQAQVEAPGDLQSQAETHVETQAPGAGARVETQAVNPTGAGAHVEAQAVNPTGAEAPREGAGAASEDQTPAPVVPKKAPKSCVVNMASDDEQRSKENENQGEKSSGEPEVEAVKAPPAARRGRKPGVKKGAENFTGVPVPRTRASSKETKNVQVSFDLASQPFTDAQQVQLRAQILVYGAVIQGSLPDESLMGAAFIDVSQVHGLESFESQLSSSRSMWEKVWKAGYDRIQKASSLPSSPSSRTPRAKPGKIIKPSPLTTASPSELTSGFPLANSVLNMASATISSWNSARNRQAPVFNPWGITPGFQPPLQGSWPSFGSSFPAPQAAPAAPSIVDDRSKGTKRKREPSTPAGAAPAAQGLVGSDISPATAGLIEDVPGQRGDIVSPGELEKSLGAEELVDRLISAKQRAEEAASAAAGVVEQSQSVWNEVKEKRRSNEISGKEARLASSFAAVTAAASVAKAAAAAANVAYAAALQARALANDLVSSGALDESSEDPSVIHVDERYKALVSGARALVKEQAQAASFSLTRAENLDAVIRAAELASEAAKQAGRVMSIGDPSSVSLGVVQKKVSRSPRSRAPRKEAARSKEQEEEEEEQQKEQEDEEAPENEDEPVMNTVEILDGELEPSEGMVVEDKQQKSRSDEIVVGSHVEIAPDEDDLQGVWFSGKVVALHGDQATVVYDELMDDDGSGKLEEQIDLTSRLGNVPRVRIAHPMTKEGGMRKRRRASLGNQIWIKGDRVDVWIRDGWWQGIVQSLDEDESLVTVYFPGDGDSEVTKSWNLRPTLVWQDDSWVYWRDLHPMKQQKLEDSGNNLVETQRTSTVESSKAQKKPAKKRKFSDVIEKEEARKPQPPQQQQRKASKPTKAASPQRSGRRGSSLPSWGSKAKKKILNTGPEAAATSDEVRKSGRTIQPTSKFLEGMETTPKTFGKKVGATAS